MKKLLFALALLLPGLCQAAVQSTVQPSIERYLQSGTTVEAYNLDGNGNMRLGGQITPISTGTVIGAFSPGLFTLAALNAAVPGWVGQYVTCTDCTRSALCVSSGTVVGSWVITNGTGTFAGASFSGFQHCQ